MKKKAKLIIPSLLTILGCIAISAGSTYSLFTSTSTNNITISSGKVDVKSSLTIEKLFSPTTIDSEGNVSGNSSSLNDNKLSGSFYSGSIAIDSEGNIELNNLLPGDKAILKLEIKNNSTISSKFMVDLESTSGLTLYDLLTIEFYDNYDSESGTLSNDESNTHEFVKGVSSIKSKDWVSLNGVNTETSVLTKYLLIEAPSSLSYGMGLSTNLSLKVEAVQGNGTTSTLYDLPSGVTTSSFENNNVYFNGTYYKGLIEAVNALNNDSSLTSGIFYLKPNASYSESNDDITLLKSFEVYGNNATLTKGRFALEHNSTLSQDIEVTIHDMNNLEIWGHHESNYNVTFNVDNSNFKSAYISRTGSTSSLIYNFDSCIREGENTSNNAAIYNCSNGEINLTNSIIKGYAAGVQTSHKVTGTLKRVIKDSSFIDVGVIGDKADWKAPLRIKEGISSATGSLEVTNTNFYYSSSSTLLNGYDILLNYTDTESEKESMGSISYKLSNTNATVLEYAGSITKQ